MDNYQEKYEQEYLEAKLYRDRERELELRYYEERRSRQFRIVLMIVVVFSTSLFFAYIFFDLSNTIKFFSYGLIGITIVLAFFSYLQPTRIRSSVFPDSISEDIKSEFMSLRKSNREFERQNRELREKFDNIVKQLQKGGAAGELFSKTEKENILNRIQAKLESESLEDYQKSLVAIVNEKLRSKLQEDVFRQISSRLESEVQNLAKRGNVNLILGISTTLTGLGILGYSVFDAPEMKSMIDIASHFIPRLSLVLLIEVFAYFFLKLYKQSLSEIKYFQNEITNIESKYLGLQLAVNSGIEGSAQKVVDSLIATERNFILEKGQSTVELEHGKEEAKRSSELMKILDSAVKKAK